MCTKWEPYAFGCLPLGACFRWEKQLCVKTAAQSCTVVSICACGCRETWRGIQALDACDVVDAEVTG